MTRALIRHGTDNEIQLKSRIIKQNQATLSAYKNLHLVQSTYVIANLGLRDISQPPLQLIPSYFILNQCTFLKKNHSQ